MKSLLAILLLCSPVVAFSQYTLQLVDETIPGTLSSFTVLKDKLFFTSRDASYKYSLYVTQGAPANTIKLSDLNYNQQQYYPKSNFVQLGNNIWFNTGTSNVSDNYVLWKSNGTIAGTEIVNTHPLVTNQLTSYKGNLWYIFNKAIYKFNPTDYSVTSFYNTQDKISTLTGTPDFDKMYWFMERYTNIYTKVFYLIETNGENGNIIFKNYLGESNSTTTGGSNTHKRIRIERNRLVWSTFAEQHNTVLHYYGGLESQITGFPIFSTANSDAYCILATTFTDNTVFVFSRDYCNWVVPPYPGPIELYAMDLNGNIQNIPLPPGVSLNIPLEFPDASPGKSYFSTSRFMYFASSSPSNGNILYRSDGTIDGTYFITDGNPGLYPVNPYFLGRINDRALFIALGPQGYGIYITSEDGDFVKRLADMPADYIVYNGINGIVVDHDLYLLFHTTSKGQKLWVLKNASEKIALETNISKPENQISVYPTETDGWLYFSLPYEKTATLSVFDLLGHPIAQRSAAGNLSWDVLSQQPSGMYIVNILIDKQMKSVRVIKE